MTELLSFDEAWDMAASECGEVRLPHSSIQSPTALKVESIDVEVRSGHGISNFLTIYEDFQQTSWCWKSSPGELDKVAVCKPSIQSTL